MEDNNFVIEDFENASENVDLFGDDTFSDFLCSRIISHGKDVFQIDGITGKCVTFNELLNESKMLAASLLRLGVRPGDTITVSSENRLEYSSVLLASLFTGAVFSPINPTYSPDEIVHILSITRPQLIFCSALTKGNVSLALPRLKDVRHVILFDEISFSEQCIKYKTLLQGNGAEKPYSARDDEITVILASSGTTGLPKGVMLNFNNLKYFCNFSRCSNTLNIKKSDIVLGLLPLFHGYGYGMLISSLMIGNKVVLLPKFEEKLFLSTVQNYKVTSLYLVPPLMVFLGKHPLVPLHDLTHVHTVISGAAPLSRDIINQVCSRLPTADIRQGYGMTESSIVITITPPGSNNIESVGKLASGIQAKIVDVLSGQALERGQQGEVCVRGPCVMAGYCRDPQSTASTIDSAGWLHTGDIGYVDQQGYFYIVDRIKGLIKYKGYQVAPAELESILMGLEGVMDAAVVGMKDVTAGELPVAYVVLQPSSDLTARGILNFVNGKVSPHKRLRQVRFIDSIPRNPSGKILHRLLRDALNSKL